MEFLRFGSSIPGEHWGCCAGDIIQNFNQDPDTPASIQLVTGDGGGPMTTTDGSSFAFLGSTLRDIFMSRLRISTFNKSDQPNRFCFAVITKYQIDTEHGKKWLAILKETGFEFVGCQANSVGGGPKLASNSGSLEYEVGINYIFGLFRNIGNGRVKDQFKPPEEWEALPSVVPEVYTYLSEENKKEIIEGRDKAHLEVWNKIGPAKVLSEADIVAAGAPVILAGIRSQFPPAKKEDREKTIAAFSKQLKNSSGFIPPTSSGIQNSLYVPTENSNEL